MNSPDPIPPVITPLPSEWDSAVIRRLAYAAMAVVATIIADGLGLSSEAFLARGGRIVDSIIEFGLIAWPLYMAYKARKYKANPPITPQAIVATEKREEKIARAPEAAKEEAAK